MLKLSSLKEPRLKDTGNAASPWLQFLSTLSTVSEIRIISNLGPFAKHKHAFVTNRFELISKSVYRLTYACTFEFGTFELHIWNGLRAMI